MANRSLTTERLHQIEQEATRCRTVIAERLEHLGLSFDRDVDLRIAASLMIGGDVQSTQNLTHEGERLAGMLVWGEHGSTVYYEAYDPHVRQRFSIAHELGHFCLHAHSSERIHHRCQSGAIDPEEVPLLGAEVDGVNTVDTSTVVDIEAEADAFAGALLLPAEQIQAARDEFGNCDAFLANWFQVSEPTIRRRSKTLAALRIFLPNLLPEEQD